MTPNGTAIRATREDRGISLRALAARTGLHRSYLSRVERGLVGAREPTIRRIADVLEVPPADITARGDRSMATTEDNLDPDAAEMRRWTPEEVVDKRLLPYRSARYLRDKVRAGDLYHHADGGRITFTAEDIRRNSALGARQPLPAAA